MNFLNDDFETSQGPNTAVNEFREYYNRSERPSYMKDEEKPLLSESSYTPDRSSTHGSASGFTRFFRNTMVLSERAAINYSRNLLAYGVRAGMYGGKCHPSFT